jgi:hypothetical protein
MIHFRNVSLTFLLLAMMLLIFVRAVGATSIYFTVRSGSEETTVLDLIAGDHVLIKFSVIGTSENYLHFYMTCPNGTEKDFGNVSSFNYNFICDAEGEYTLHFSNTGSAENKLVTLDYEVDHYILGMPQMLFLTLIIVFICLAAVAVFIFMGKPH